MKKNFILILIISLIIMPCLNQVYAIESFSNVFGGNNNGVDALAFMTVMTGLGVAFVNQSDAIQVYNDIKENSPQVIADMVSIVKDTWLGAYSTVSDTLISVKDTVYDYLVSKFGDLTVGENTISSKTYRLVQSTSSNIILNTWTGKDSPIEHLIIQSSNNLYSIYYYARASEIYISYDLGQSYIKALSLNLNDDIEYRCIYDNGLLKLSRAYNGGWLNFINTRLNYNSNSMITDLPVVEDGIKINISSDADVLDGEFEPDERDPIILPPPFFPNLDFKEKTTPSGATQKYFDGTIDDYLGQVADNNTWSDVNEYLNTGTNTTTLTDAGTDGLAVGDVNVDGIPYPEVGVTAPTDVLTGIGGITGLLQGINNWIAQLLKTLTDAFAVPTDLTLNFDSLKLVNFQDKFPFSIPWDLYRAISAFAKSPTTPNIAIDMDTDYFQIYHEIDLTSISIPLAFARYASVVFFIMFLIGKTRDLIKW